MARADGDGALAARWPQVLLSPLADVLGRRRLVFVGGKGGVGKTTIAAALAVAAADTGRRCLLVSTDPAHSLGDIFGAPVDDAPTALADRLAGVEIDPEREAERHIATVTHRLKELVHPRMYDAVDRQLDLARFAPGTIEAALVERMADLMAAAGRDVDLVIFDTAPTGHTLRLLSLPEIMAAWTDGLLRHRERSSALASVLGRFGGAGGDELSLIDTPRDHPPNRRSEHLHELLLARRRKLGRARELLLDREATAFVLVLNPDKLSILEGRKTLETLERAGVPVAAAVVNRVLPAASGPSDDSFLSARRRQEEVYLQEIERLFAGVPRHVVPLLPEDVHGLDGLRRFGRALV